MDNQADQVQQLFLQGSAFLRSGRLGQALHCFQGALGIDPSNPTLYLYTGATLHDLKRYDEAVACYEKTLQLAPATGEAHNNLGNALMALGRFGEAVGSFSRAATLLPTSPVPLAARATALQALGMVSDAETECRKALAIDPGFAAAHWNLALNLLLQGRYLEGWAEYEWRWKKPDFTSPLRHLTVPRWDGAPLQGRAILLHAEQGFGDAIQFMRYAPLVAQRGGTVIVECHPQLVHIMQTVPGVARAVPFGVPLPPFSCQAPLLSLPHILGTTLQTVPSLCPYVSITAEYRKKWAAIMATQPATMRVGLVWAGKDYPDPLRSCRLADLAPLAAGSNSTFYSLQLGAGSEQAVSPPSGMPLIDLTGQIHDFADTGALIEQLDLVVSIDTAVAHLAGALGKPVYVMLPLAPDWRWLLHRKDSPWYPTMKLFRQKQPGAWGEVVINVRADLNSFADANKKIP